MISIVQCSIKALNIFDEYFLLPVLDSRFRVHVSIQKESELQATSIDFTCETVVRILPVSALNITEYIVGFNRYTYLIEASSVHVR